MSQFFKRVRGFGGLPAKCNVPFFHSSECFGQALEALEISTSRMYRANRTGQFTRNLLHVPQFSFFQHTVHVVARNHAWSSAYLLFLHTHGRSKDYAKRAERGRAEKEKRMGARCLS